MKIAIIGTGGVGGYFGGKLAKAGNEVVFLARGEHLIAMQKNGLEVKSINGDFIINPVSSTDRINEIGEVDLVIIGVKAWQVKEISKEIMPLLHNDTLIIPLQNGVLAADELKEVLPEKHIIGGLCRIISKIEAPGVINHFAVEPTLIFGELNQTISARLQKVKADFEKADFDNILTDDIHTALWEKFIAINVSGLMAVTKTTYGEMRELKETRKMMIDLLNEIYSISKKAGINIKDDFVTKTVNFIDSFPYDSTSSLTRDVWEGKPSEIEYQNGTVVRLGEKYGVDTPVNRFVYNSILPGELKVRKSID